MPSSVRPPSSRRHPLLAPGTPRPLLAPIERKRVVREMRRDAQVGPFEDPRLLAYELGITAMPYFPEHGEAHPGPHIAGYPWHRDEAERGYRLDREIARVRLMTLRMPHNAGDIELVTFDLGVPEEFAMIGVERMVARQRHFPEAMIRVVMALRDDASHS